MTYTKDEACSNIAKLVEDFCARRAGESNTGTAQIQGGSEDPVRGGCVQRQIKSVDEAIDGLVYDLYELTQAGIKIIETK